MPDDPTPHGGEALHAPPDRARIPAPEAGLTDDAPPVPAAAPADIAARPALPTQPVRTAADIEDEDADPVIDSGPGIDDDPAEPPSVTRQPA